MITNREKVAFLKEIDRRQGLGETLRGICRSLRIQPSQARRWKQLEDKLSQPNVGNRGSLHAGHPSILASVEADLLSWFFELCEQGIMVSTRLIVIKASQLNAQFRRKSPRAKELAVRRLLSSNRIVTRCVTHTCQRPPAHAVRQEALDFISYVRDKVVGGNREGKYIINMDQTPIFFDMSTGRTLSQSGKQPRHSFLFAVLSILHHKPPSYIVLRRRNSKWTNINVSNILASNGCCDGNGIWRDAQASRCLQR